LSIDKDAATVVTHVNNKGWTSVKHYHRAGSDASDVYQVRGVPCVMIIDTKGKIAFKGHPAQRKDLVADFNALLEGKDLDGVEKPGEKAEPAEEEGEGKKSTAEDIEKAMNEMDTFKTTTGKELISELKEEATGMMRNFCVLTLSANYNPQDDSWTSEYMNHRVIIGPQAKVDVCKEKVEAKMKEGWSFEVNN